MPQHTLRFRTLSAKHQEAVVWRELQERHFAEARITNALLLAGRQVTEREFVYF